MGPDGHLQDLALAVRIGAAFREVLCRRFRLGSNFLRFFAVRHKSPDSSEMAGTVAGWRENRELTCPPGTELKPHARRHPLHPLAQLRAPEDFAGATYQTRQAF